MSDPDIRRIAISVHDTVNQKYYRASLTIGQVRRYDNGAMVSCGLSAPEDLSLRTLHTWIKRGTAVEVSYETWNHSGCQSSCVLRGAKECRW